MNIHEVVKKLVGEIEPVGETREDDRRFENLKEMTDLIDKLLTDIDSITWTYNGRIEHSIKRSVDFVNKFQDKMGIKG